MHGLIQLGQINWLCLRLRSELISRAVADRLDQEANR